MPPAPFPLAYRGGRNSLSAQLPWTGNELSGYIAHQVLIDPDFLQMTSFIEFLKESLIHFFCQNEVNKIPANAYFRKHFYYLEAKGGYLNRILFVSFFLQKLIDLTKTPLCGTILNFIYVQSSVSFFNAEILF